MNRWVRASSSEPVSHVNVQRAIHIHAAQTAAANAVDAWLEQHGVDVTRCADAFDACTHILKNGIRVPQLAFVGADWLETDEFAILQYLRETWPAIGIVIYGRGIPATLRTPGPHTLLCPTPAALDEILAALPQNLLDRIRRAPPVETPFGQPRTASLETLQPATTGNTAQEDPPDSKQPRSTLTPEELSMLLGDGHD